MPSLIFLHVLATVDCGPNDLVLQECPTTKSMSTFWGRIGIIPIVLGALFVLLLLAFFVMSCDQVIEECCGSSVTKIEEKVPCLKNMNRSVSDHVSVWTTLKIAYTTAQIIWSVSASISSLVCLQCKSSLAHCRVVVVTQVGRLPDRHGGAMAKSVRRARRGAMRHLLIHLLADARWAAASSFFLFLFF